MFWVFGLYLVEYSYVVYSHVCGQVMTTLLSMGLAASSPLLFTVSAQYCGTKLWIQGLYCNMIEGVQH